jgi:hypothetical protein
MSSGSGQRRGKPARCHPSRPAETLRQMALVAEPGFERYRGQRLTGALPHQGLGPFDPPLHDGALRADTDRLLERPAEKVRAEASGVREHSQRKTVIEMRFDVVAHALQPFRRKALAGRQQEMVATTPREAYTKECARAFDQDPVYKAAFNWLKF